MRRKYHRDDPEYFNLPEEEFARGLRSGKIKAVWVDFKDAYGWNQKHFYSLPRAQIYAKTRSLNTPRKSFMVITRNKDKGVQWTYRNGNLINIEKFIFRN